MKKLMIAAVAAAMAAGSYAACSEVVETTTAEYDLVWDLSLKAKTLAPKKLSCKTTDVCGETTKGTVYYLDSASRTLKGVIWACDYTCEDATFYIGLWDTKNKRAVIAIPSTGFEGQELDFVPADLMVFGKKANKVAATFNFVGVDATGADAIDVTAAGVNGKIASKSAECADATCYLKSISGYFAGSLLPVIPNTTTYGTTTKTTTSLCGEDTIEIDTCDEVEEIEVIYTTLCEVCGGFDGWCAAEECAIVLDGMVPAVGTWSMKINSKASKGKKGIQNFVPAYAL